MANSRLAYIDHAKGLAMLLMVFAHTAPEEHISTWIFAFHMPLFFIVSGFLMKRKLSQKIFTLPDIWPFIKKRSFQLGLPYFVFSLLLAIFYSSLCVFAGTDCDFPHYMFQILTLQGIDSLWFIPCFFVAELMMRLTLYTRSWIHIFGCVTITGICLYFLYMCDIPSEWGIRLCIKFLVCYSFVYIGYVLASYRLFQRFKKSWALFLLILCSLGALYNGFSAIGSLQLNNPFLFYINATCMTLAFFSLLDIHMRTEVDVLSFWGRNTIVILCTNNLIIELIRLIDHKIANDSLLSLGLLGCLVFTMLIIAIEIPLIKSVMNTKLSILFGKKQYS